MHFRVSRLQYSIVGTYTLTLICMCSILTGSLCKLEAYAANNLLNSYKNTFGSANRSATKYYRLARCMLKDWQSMHIYLYGGATDGHLLRSV